MKMGLIFDAIIIAVFVIAIIRGIKNGFAKTVLSTVAFVLAIITAILFYKPIAAKLGETKLPEKIEAFVEERINSVLERGEEEKTEETGQAEEKAESETIGEQTKEKLLEAIKALGINSEKASGYVREIVDGKVSEATEKIAETLTKTTLNALGFIIAFVASFIVYMVIVLLIRLLCELPVLKAVDKTLGAIFGIIFAYLIACGISSWAPKIAEILSDLDIYGGLVDGSYLIPFFRGFNLIEVLMQALFG